MAIDELLLREIATDRRPSAARIWECSAPAVVIDSFQSLCNEVDLGQACRLGITVVRRISGGDAMFIEPDNTITYSLYARDSLIAGWPGTSSRSGVDRAPAVELSESRCPRGSHATAAGTAAVGFRRLGGAGVARPR